MPLVRIEYSPSHLISCGHRDVDEVFCSFELALAYTLVGFETNTREREVEREGEKKRNLFQMPDGENYQKMGNIPKERISEIGI